MQEVYLHVWTKQQKVLRSFDPNRGTLNVFLFRTAFHRAHDILRREAVYTTHHQDPETPELAPVLEARDLLRRLLDALMGEFHLESDQVALLAIVRGDTLVDVALERKMTVAYLNKCVWRVRRRARALAEEMASLDE